MKNILKGLGIGTLGVLGCAIYVIMWAFGTLVSIVIAVMIVRFIINLIF